MARLSMLDWVAMTHGRSPVLVAMAFIHTLYLYSENVVEVNWKSLRFLGFSIHKDAHSPTWTSYPFS